MSGSCFDLANAAYRISVSAADGEVRVVLKDLAMDFDLAEGPYVYRASRACDEGTLVVRRLDDLAAETRGDTLKIGGALAGLRIEHRFTLPADRPLMEERISLRNPTDSVIPLDDFAAGMQRRVADAVGETLPELRSDRFVALPFRHRTTDPAGFDNDFTITDLLERAGREHRVAAGMRCGYFPSLQRSSEGWTWMHGKHALGVFKFNQAGIEFSVLSPEVWDDGLAMRFGGAGLVAGDPSSLRRILPGQTVELGVTRYVTVKGDYRQASYAFRTFLDEMGCRFPKGFNPPVHWNELYDNAEWSLGTPGKPLGPRMTRAVTYTREAMEQEARKAVEYNCEALYLDPGWDTDFGTFLWGEQWLGPRKQFIDEMRLRHGLKVSLHCPLANWMSKDGRGVSSWPPEAWQMDADGNVRVGAVCLGSRQYLDEAARRLAEHCADGVAFLMFDGNWWNGGCWNPDHGHPTPYALEGHCRANVELARKVHQQYPRVLIEMHDMITGPVFARYTPVYYKYGLPGSYDENWGFELMWAPLEDLRRGYAKSLYYYNLGCNVPIYLHIDLRDDNEHCVALWWYASTCRHLGIGGTHGNPAVAQAQKLAMKKYRKLERFYKEGEFYGIHEEAHVHALPDENAFVLNLFNLCDQARVVGGAISFAEMGLERDRWYVTPRFGSMDSRTGTFSIQRRMPPWSTEVLEVHALAGLK